MLIAVIAAFILREYIEAVMVISLFKIGEMLESYVEAKTNKNVTSLINIGYDKARIKNEHGEFILMDANKAKVGDLILIKPGDKIALDCVVIEGNSVLDTSSLTGESKPFSALVGSYILSGSTNVSGFLTCKVNNTFSDSTANKIIELLKNSTSNKSNTEKFITRFARIYTPIVIICAILVATIPLAVDINR